MGGKHHNNKSNKSDTNKYRAQSQRHPKISKAKVTVNREKQQKQRTRQTVANTETSRQESQQKVVPSPQENLSFCGCGFLGIYHVGVASCFHEYAPQLSMHKISGSSAGSLVAVAHICGNLQLAYATTDILRVAIDARARALGPLHPSFDINAIVTDALERGLPDDVHLKVSGKLHISLTRLDDLQNVIVSKFDSKEDVIQAIICSCFIPCWSGFVPPKYKGVAYIDGGFSNNLLILDDKTVTVSPFAGEADICPQDDVHNLLTVSISNTSFSMTPHNLYRLSHALIPPPPEVLSELCERGFADGIRFLQRMKLISCIKCLEIRSESLLVSSSSHHETDSEISSRHIERKTSFSAAYRQNIRQRRDSISSCDSYTNITTAKAIATTSRGDNISISSSAGGGSSGTPFDSRSFNLEEGEEEDESGLIEELFLKGREENDCDGCILRRTNALRDPLPKVMTDSIRVACDDVNKSLYNWFYSHRPIKYLSYLAAPMNISLALLLKYWQQLPYIGLELFKCLAEVKDFLVEIAKRVYDRSTTSLLLSSAREVELASSITGSKQEQEQQQTSAESSISVKITADCRQLSMRSLTTYECCLTIVLFGRRSLFSMQK